MDNRRSVRNRAVRLTPEGLELLKAGMVRAWESDPNRSKLTREARADILGVSLGTADRIMKQQGVDRSTLSLTFKKLGLTWDDRFCELVSRGKGEPEEPSADHSSATLTRTPFRQRPWRRALLAVGGVLALVLAVALTQPPTPESKESIRHSGFLENLTAAEQAYHKADYAAARYHLAQVLTFVEENPKAPELSLALRLAGDVASSEGKYTEALNSYRDALVIRRRTNRQPNTIPPLLEAIGDTELKLQNYESATGYFSECLQGYKSMGDLGGQAMALRGLGSAAAGLGNVAEAKRRFNEGLAVIEGQDSAAMAADIRARLALVLRDEGRLDEAKTMLANCLDYWQEAGHKRWIAKTRYELGTVEYLLGRANVAMMMLSQSRADYESLGDEGGVDACQTWLSRVVADASARGAADLAEHSESNTHVATGPERRRPGSR